MKPIAILAEQADQIAALVAELGARGLSCIMIDPRSHTFDPTDKSSPYSLVVNLVSPIKGQCIEYTALLLMHYERIDIRVLNGSVGMGFLGSLARQTILIDQSGLSTPKRKVISVVDGQSTATVKVEDAVSQAVDQSKQITIVGSKAIHSDRFASSIVQNAEQLLRHASLDFGIVEYDIDRPSGTVRYLGLSEYVPNTPNEVNIFIDYIEKLITPVKLQSPFDALSHMADWDAAI